MNKISQIFCKHDYEKISWREDYDNYTNTRFSIRLYKCNKCGKEIWVDGRLDFIASKN